MKSRSPVGLLYLGSRGAGVKFTELLMGQLPESGKEVVIFTGEGKKKDNNKNKIVVVKIPKSKALVALGFGRAKAFNQIITACQESNTKRIIIPMAHPWDLHFQNGLKSKGIKIIRIIHDGKRHPGDVWPTNLAIQKMCDVDRIVTLSRYTASLLNNCESKTIISAHPELQYGSSVSSSDIPVTEKNYDLIIGRQKRYQNTSNVVKWWRKLPQNVTENRKLVVAGKLSFITRVALAGSKNVIFVSRWLTDSEYGNLVSGASRVLCLYREASQSGVVAAAQARKVPVLVSDVGGLSEQINSFGGGSIASLSSQADWQLKYEGLGSLPILNGTHQSPTSDFINRVLESLDFSNRESE
jgi:glycosyltransferase involved in cell wall biosynthesis